ncbi:MAG TPA: nucleotidyl transferase AbiEii/AbiGii toxin family protein, partial [Ignavibacteria bacterium]|nr:nucleotidyl transferase AbiEii/AbiGii toxin family protein [Ignavibacteria bacterium]
MIPKIYITQWKRNVPWKSDYQVEQDLIIERALIEIFSNSELKEQLAFRGGTALHKLFLKPQVRYSEDIDLVQIKSGSIGNVLTLLREKLEFIGKANYNASKHNATLIYRFESETKPGVRLRLKIEINIREHYTVFNYKNYKYSVKSEWFDGSCV